MTLADHPLRIAIVRLTSLGDVIHGLPVAAAIRDRRPSAVIAWIVEEHEQVLLQGNPLVDEIVLVPLRRWRRSAVRGSIGPVAREIRQLVTRLQSLAIDVTIDLQGWTHKTSPIVALTRAPMRIGFSRSHARRPWSTLFTTHQITPPASAVHIVDQNLALLEPLGISGCAARFVLPPWEDADAPVDAWMAAHVEDARRPIVLLPSTRGRRKFWPAESYTELVVRLARDTGRPIVLAGSPAEQPLLDRIQSGAGEARCQVYMPEPLAELAHFLARAALVVGNDTGPLHLAAAAAVPAIGLFGPTRGIRNGPYGPRGTFIQSPSERMSDIPVESVLTAAMQALREVNQ